MMKKIALLLICTLMFTSCDIDDDETGFIQVYAEVADADLPESLELGKIFTVNITYLLPDACHAPQGLYVRRGGNHGPERRNIYVAGVASRPASLTECNDDDDDLEIENSFAVRIDENEPFTFYLWTGVDEEGESVYNQVIVPVAESSSTADE